MNQQTNQLESNQHFLRFSAKRIENRRRGIKQKGLTYRFAVIEILS